MMQSFFYIHCTFLCLWLCGFSWSKNNISFCIGVPPQLLGSCTVLTVLFYIYIYILVFLFIWNHSLSKYIWVSIISCLLLFLLLVDLLYFLTHFFLALPFVLSILGILPVSLPCIVHQFQIPHCLPIAIKFL